MNAPVLRVTGGGPLEGAVTVHGMKNAALPALVAACLADEPTTLRNVPTGLHDIRLLGDILRGLGARVEVHGETVVCARGDFPRGSVPPESAGRLRWAILLMGAAVALRQEMLVPATGGCALGPRPHDIHLAALRALGGDLEDTPEGVRVRPAALAGAEVAMRYAVISGTANVLIAAALTPGETVVRGAAYEPETRDLARLLNAMGARVTLRQAGVWHVRGVERLHGAEHRVMGDRFVAATYVTAAALTGGAVEVRGAALDTLPAEASVWSAGGLRVEEVDGGIHVAARRGRLRSSDVATGPWPGYQSDLQPLHAVLMAVRGDGECTISDGYFSDRFGYLDQLRRMGADVEYARADFRAPNGEWGKVARIRPGRPLRGARLSSSDIRAGAALVLAALVAEGESEVDNLYQIERGYVGLDAGLRSLGAAVERVEPAMTSRAAGAAAAAVLAG